MVWNRTLRAFLPLLAVSLVAGTGCGNRSPEGGPTGTGVTGASDGFHLTGPPAVALKAGDRQTVNLTVNRGANFK